MTRRIVEWYQRNAKQTLKRPPIMWKYPLTYAYMKLRECGKLSVEDEIVRVAEKIVIDDSTDAGSSKTLSYYSRRGRGTRPYPAW